MSVKTDKTKNTSKTSTKTKRTSKPKEEVNTLPMVYDETNSTPLEILKKYYGYTSFRTIQQDVIQSVLDGNDTVCFMPTGGGKSVVLQIPALIGKGITICVMPLLALMEDQLVDAINSNIAAVTINSTIGVKARRKTLEQIRKGEIKLLYTSPETLLGDKFQDFRDVLKEVGVSYIMVDEAHMMSQWSDFRPAYTKVGDIRLLYPDAPVLAVTATADEKVLEDIILHSAIKPDYKLYSVSFDRPNIHLNIIDLKYSASLYLTDILKKYPKGTKGIVYCQTREKCESIATFIKGLGYKAAFFHAGMKAKDKAELQKAYKNDEFDIIVATVAFGMGINIPDIRFVVQYDCPDSFEDASQKLGRAGRDGLHSDSYILYDPKTFNSSSWLIRQSTSSPVRLKIKMDKLRALHNYCNTRSCRRVGLLAAFGETYTKTNCNSCDVCLNTVF